MTAQGSGMHIHDGHWTWHATADEKNAMQGLMFMFRAIRSALEQRAWDEFVHMSTSAMEAHQLRNGIIRDGHYARLHCSNCHEVGHTTRSCSNPVLTEGMIHVLYQQDHDEPIGPPRPRNGQLGPRLGRGLTVGLSR
jgi:hypothetical protein